jgi:hypothetical protein
VGFAFATTLYEAMFPLNNFDQGFGAIIQQFMETIFTKFFNMLVTGGYHTVVGDVLGNLIGYLVGLGKKLGYLLIASTIVTAFVLSGVSFVLAAPSVALRWSHAFNSEDILHKVMASIKLVQGSMAAAYGEIYGQQFTALQDKIGGVVSGAQSAAAMKAPQK